MKKLKRLVAFASITVFIAICGCKEEVAITMEQVTQIEDSIPKAIPTTSTMNIFVVNNSELKIVIGDTRFYNADPVIKQEKANQVGLMALKVLGPGITKGKLIITKNVVDKLENPNDGISTDMNIDSLKKVVFPAK